MPKIELLLPAGNMDCLKAAVENGADAVYLGINRFNARRRADNFSLDKISEAINYAHKNGVKAYCTLNILIKNSEIYDFFETIKQLYLAGIDAIIIQHLSFLPIIKQNFPGLEVHLSTQTAITNTHFYELIKEADKIVLPREFSKEEIQNFIQKTKLPAEIFVQGALCFSYSGTCLFSSFLGGRSGNRGLCAQPCRKNYNGSCLLSMKDLCLVEKIPEIIGMGISSLKIEGRLRSPKYVAAAAKLYRTAIDSYYAGKLKVNPELFQVDQELFKEMELSFNREFTTGYFPGELSVEKQLISPERSMSRGIYLGTMEENNLIHLQESLVVGDGLGIWFKDKVDGAVLRKMESEGKEIKTAKAGEKVKLFIRAPVGTKIYKTSSINPPTKIVFQKKEPITLLCPKLHKIILPEIKEQKSNKTGLLVKVYSKKDAQEALHAGAAQVFYNIFAEDFSGEYGAYIPRILNDEEVEKALSLIYKYKVKSALIGDLGVYAALKQKKELGLREIELYLDYSNNIFNDLDLNYFEDSIPIISPELSFHELQQFRNKNFAVFVHGKIVLMNTKYAYLPKTLKDERRYVFPTRKEHSYYQILNSVESGLFEEVKRLKAAGISLFFLDLDREVGSTIKLYKDILANKPVNYSKKNYTKGHWERGVE